MPTEYWQLVAGSSSFAFLIQCAICRPARTSRNMLGQATREYLAHGNWLFGQSTLQLLADTALFLISGWFLPKAELGIWRSLQTVSGFLNPALIALESIVPARARRRYQDAGKQAADIWLRNAFFVAAIPFFLVALSIAVFARQITAILFPSIAPGWEWIAQCSCAILFLQMIKFFIVLYARLYGKTREIMVSSFSCFMLSVSLSYPLLRYFGIQGGVYGLVGLQLFGVGSATLFLWLEHATAHVRQAEKPSGEGD